MTALKNMLNITFSQKGLKGFFFRIAFTLYIIRTRWLYFRDHAMTKFSLFEIIWLSWWLNFRALYFNFWRHIRFSIWWMSQIWVRYLLTNIDYYDTFRIFYFFQTLVIQFPIASAFWFLLSHFRCLDLWKSEIPWRLNFRWVDLWKSEITWRVNFRWLEFWAWFNFNNFCLWWIILWS